MPGGDRLAAELGIGADTVEAALGQLEEEGLLVNQGRRRGRLIDLQGGDGPRTGLRVAIQLHEPLALSESYIVELQHLLQEAGFTAFFTEKCLIDLQMDVSKLAGLVERTAADLWVVVAGPRHVLDWFVGRGVPVMALFGRRRELPIAGVGPDKEHALRAVVRRLVELGHHRMVLLALASRRLPEPGLPERAYIDELAAHGILTGSYNLPDWEESPEGLQRMLDSLFRLTPPTALIVDEAFLFHAVKQHLSHRGVRAPDEVSLICTDPDRTFTWCRPSVAHIRWESAPVVRRIVRWANNVARGREDRRQTLTPAVFVEGGTIGPAIR